MFRSSFNSVKLLSNQVLFFRSHSFWLNQFSIVFHVFNQIIFRSISTFRSTYSSIILFFDQIIFLLYYYSIKWPFLVGGVSRQANHLIDGLLDTCFELERTQKLSIQKLFRLNVIIYWKKVKRERAYLLLRWLL